MGWALNVLFNGKTLIVDMGYRDPISLNRQLRRCRAALVFLRI